MMTDRFDPQPVMLSGRCVRLEPLGEQHADDLLAAGSDPAIWRYLPRGPFKSIADVSTWIEGACSEMARIDGVPFAIIDLATQRAIGSSRYLAIRRAHRGLEVGWTWLGISAQRTAINTECKLLLLGHAFDDLGALRVEFKTDSRNERSRAAILRIGASFEGAFRKHMICPDGELRDSAYYSVLEDEWPQVRAKLEQRLAQG